MVVEVWACLPDLEGAQRGGELLCGFLRTELAFSLPSRIHDLEVKSCLVTNGAS
jgi:hypothetical protein